MYQEARHDELNEGETADRDILVEYDTRIAEAGQELAQARDDIRNKPYPADAKERAAVYSQRLIDIDKKQRAVTQLTIEKLEAEERLEQGMEM